MNCFLILQSFLARSLFVAIAMSQAFDKQIRRTWVLELNSETSTGRILNSRVKEKAGRQMSSDQNP